MNTIFSFVVGGCFCLVGSVFAFYCFVHVGSSFVNLYCCLIKF